MNNYLEMYHGLAAYSGSGGIYQKALGLLGNEIAAADIPLGEIGVCVQGIAREVHACDVWSDVSGGIRYAADEGSYSQSTVNALNKIDRQERRQSSSNTLLAELTAAKSLVTDVDTFASLIVAVETAEAVYNAAMSHYESICSKMGLTLSSVEVAGAYHKYICDPAEAKLAAAHRALRLHKYDVAEAKATILSNEYALAQNTALNLSANDDVLTNATSNADIIDIVRDKKGRYIEAFFTPEYISRIWIKQSANWLLKLKAKALSKYFSVELILI